MLSEEMGLEGMKSIVSEDLEEEEADGSSEMRGSLSISWSAIVSNTSGCIMATHRTIGVLIPITGKPQVLIEGTRLRRRKKGTGESNPSRLRSSPDGTSNLVPPTVHL